MLMEGSGKQAVKCKIPLWVTGCRWGKKNQTILMNKDNCNPSHPSIHIKAHSFHSWNKKQKPEPQVTENISENPEKKPHKLLHSQGCFHYRLLAENDSLEMVLWKLAPGLQLPKQVWPPRRWVSSPARAIKQTWAAEPGRSDPVPLTEVSRLSLGWTISP